MRWADLEDPSAEDEERTCCTATRIGEGILGLTPELRAPSAGASPSSPKHGHADDRRTRHSRYLAGVRDGVYHPKLGHVQCGVSRRPRGLSGEPRFASNIGAAYRLRVEDRFLRGVFPGSPCGTRDGSWAESAHR